jgi:hypothetical protein
MPNTYDPTHVNIGNSDYVSVVRFLLADTDTDVAEVSDEEITALYGDTASYSSDQPTRNVMTAYNAAKYLLTKYRKQVSFSSAGTSVQLSDRVNRWADLVNDLAYKLISVTGQYPQQPVTYPSRPSAFSEGV